MVFYHEIILPKMENGAQASNEKCNNKNSVNAEKVTRK